MKSYLKMLFIFLFCFVLLALLRSYSNRKRNLTNEEQVLLKDLSSVKTYDAKGIIFQKYLEKHLLRQLRTLEHKRSSATMDQILNESNKSMICIDSVIFISTEIIKKDNSEDFKGDLKSSIQYYKYVKHNLLRLEKLIISYE